MSDAVITVENLSKQYLISHQKARGDGLRHMIERAARNPVAWLKQHAGERGRKSEEFWALKDVSFNVKQGEVVGLVGRNGAGKSTLLKILSRITEPTRGRLRLRGRVACLLEVGTGFHPELTGRENIFLNGAILGMTKVEIQKKFDEIVAFSEVEKFLDTPVKRYSSGMYVRLAFAVAAHLEPEILLIDEVLAVGDASFQKKCLGKMGEAARGGRTVVFVSHNMEAVRGLCQRGILFEDGCVRADGRVGDVVQTYLNSVAEHVVYHESKDYGLVIQQVVLKDAAGTETVQFKPGEDLVVEVSYNAKRPVEKPYLALVVQGVSGNCFTANMLLDGHRPEVLEGEGIVKCRFEAIPLLPQRYNIKLLMRAENGRDVIINYLDVATFSVVGDLEDYGYKGEFRTACSTSTPVVVPYEWELPDGTVAPVSLRGSAKELNRP